MSANLPIRSLPIDRLLVARDAYIRAYTTLEEQIREADKLAAEFNIDRPEFGLIGHHWSYQAGRDNQFLEAAKVEVDRRFWQKLFELSGLFAVMSTERKSKLQNQLYMRAPEALQRKSEAMPPLTEENISATFDGLQAAAPGMFDEAVEACFRQMSWCWKSNRPCLFGKRFIVSRYCYRSSDERALADLERVLHLLAGDPIPDQTTGFYNLMRMRNRPPEGELVAVPGSKRSLFSLRMYSKSFHVYITDEELRAKLNRIISKKYPNALPPGKG